MTDNDRYSIHPLSIIRYVNGLSKNNMGDYFSVSGKEIEQIERGSKCLDLNTLSSGLKKLNISMDQYVCIETMQTNLDKTQFEPRYKFQCMLYYYVNILINPLLKDCVDLVMQAIDNIPNNKRNSDMDINLLKLIRIIKVLNRNEMANYFSVVPSHISQLENNSRKINPNILSRGLNSLGISVEDYEKLEKLSTVLSKTEMDYGQRYMCMLYETTNIISNQSIKHHLKVICSSPYYQRLKKR